MPYRSKRPCSFPGCTNLTDSRYCLVHGDIGRQYDDQRESAARRGYDATWRKNRIMFLRAHPLCADIFRIHGDQVVTATDVDHILPRARGGSDSWDNLQALCHSCHSRKTANEDGFRTARVGG